MTITKKLTACIYFRYYCLRLYASHLLFSFFGVCVCVGGGTEEI